MKRGKSRRRSPDPIQPFSLADFNEIKHLLGLGNGSKQADATAAIVAMLIHEAALHVRDFTELIRQGGLKSDLKEINRVIGWLKSSAACLKRLGRHHPLAKALERQERSTERLASDMALASSVASDLVSDPKEYHRALRIREKSQNAASVESVILWPVLLETWLRFHTNLGLSPEGPLMTFVSLAHRHTGLPPPKYKSLQDARKRLEPNIRNKLANEALPESETERARRRALLELQSMYAGRGV